MIKRFEKNSSAFYLFTIGAFVFVIKITKVYRLKHKHVGTWVSDWESDEYVKVDEWVSEFENDSVITPSLVQLLVLFYEVK